VQPGDSESLHNAADLRLEIFTRVTDDQVTAVATTTANALAAIGPIRDATAIVELVPLSDSTNPTQAATVVPMLYRLWVAAAAVLLLAWANTTNLLLIRASDRARETAVRFALGASWRRIIATVGMEHSLLALGGGGFALIVAAWMHSILRSSVALFDRTDGKVLHAATIGTAIGIVLVASIGSTAFAAAAAPRRRLAHALGSNHRGSTVRANAIRSSIVVLQATLCILLMASAGLVLRSFANVRREWVPPDVDDLLVAHIPFATRASPYMPDTDARFHELASSIAALPNVIAFGVSSNVPIQAAMFRRVFLPGRDSVMVPGEPPASLAAVSSTYFDVLGMQVLRGRGILSSDRQGTDPIVVVSNYMAKRLWPGSSALGQCLIIGTPNAKCRVVVGVVEDAHIMKLREPPQMRYYVPLTQAVDPWVARAIVVRSRAGTTPSTMAAVRRLVDGKTAAEMQWSVARFSDILEPELRPWRVAAVAFAGLAILAALIAAVGVYGAVRHALQERRTEIAVRRALGADSAAILRVVMRAGVGLVAIGVGVGALLVVAASFAVGPILYKTNVYDPVVVIGAPALLVFVAALASVAPARSALGINPMESMLRE
jgi:predicted permease